MPASQSIEQGAAVVDEPFTGEQLRNWRQDGF
jgi:hypothetical protein